MSESPVPPEHGSQGDGAGKCLACGFELEGAAECLECGWYPAPQSNTAEPILPVLANEPVMSVKAVWWELFAVMCIGFFPHAANSFLLPAAPSSPYWVTAIQYIVQSFCSIFATLYIIHRSGENWREFGYGKPLFTDLVLGFVLTMVIWYFGGVLFWALTEESDSSLFTLPETPIDVLLMPIMYLLSSASEEIIMRSYLMTRLRHLIHRPWLSVVISSFAFAMYHTYQGFGGFVHALFFGLILGSVFVVYPRIWPLILAHTMYNILLELHAMR